MPTSFSVAAPVRTQDVVDSALVFAIDSCSSVSDDELSFQKAAILAAIQSDAVLAAIAAGPHQRIAVNFVLWGDADFANYVGEWTIVATADNVELIGTHANWAERKTMGNTGLANGIGVALQLIMYFPGLTDRKVIDVSGNGRETIIRRRERHSGMDSEWNRMSPDPGIARAMARKMGVTVNGPAIISEDADLASW